MPVTTSTTRSLRVRAGAWLALARPLNTVLFVVGVTVGGMLGAGGLDLTAAAWLRVAVAAASAALVGAGANAFNDVFDLDVDRVNRPGRPLPSGRATPREARGLGLAATAAGLGLALTLSAGHTALAAGAAALLYAYNAQLKRRPLVGNLAVALVLALALIYGGLAVGAPAAALPGAAFAFLTTLAREVVKDVEDARGDASGGARTLPLVAGEWAAVHLAAAVVLATVLLTPVPFVALGYSGLYLLLVLAADALLLRAVALLLEPSPRAARASRVLKAAMIAGLAALAGAGWTGV